MKGTLLILLLTTSFQALSGIISQADCTPTDIRNTHPKIKNNPALREHFSKPRNQDSIGWCYAFAAADLLTAHYGFPVSSLHTSIIYNRTYFSDPKLKKIAFDQRKTGHPAYEEVFEGGNIVETIPYITRNKWVCTEKGLPFDIEKPQQINQMIRNLEALKKRVASMKSSNAQVCAEFQSLISPFTMQSLDAEKIASELIVQNMNVTLDNFATKACKEKLSPTKETRAEVLNKYDKKGRTRKKLMPQMNKLLTKGTMMVFNYDVETIAGFPGKHASVIMGRRWKNNRCEYNVRNSWGEMCSPYKPGIECNKKEGSYWLSDAEIYRALTSINYIK